MTFSNRSASHSRLDYQLVAMLMIIAVLGCWSVLWGERLPINGGFGWDGLIYGTIAQTMDVRSVDPYYIQRIFPSVVVHCALAVLQQPLDNRHVVIAFSLLNFALLLFSCILYRCIAEELNLSASGFWLGFIGIYINFAYLKFAWYDPVLTDVTATALSLAMLLFYLRNQRLLLAIVTFLGAFTWPTIIYAGLFLLVFPRNPIVEEKTSQPKYLAAGLASFVFASTVRFDYVTHRDWDSSLVQPIRAALPLYIVLCMLYIYCASSLLLHGISAKTVLSSLTPRRAAIAATLFAATTIPAYCLADHSSPYVTARSTIADIVQRSVVWPLGFLVSHPVYFGPVFLLFLFYWKPFSKIIRNYGLGLTLVVFMGVFLSINTESRQNIPSYVMAVPFLGLWVQKLALPARFFWLIGAVALAYSKVWMHMGMPAYDDTHYLRFPLQNFFMSQGPWMNNNMFVLQGAIVLGTAVLLYAYLRSKRHVSNSSAISR